MLNQGIGNADTRPMGRPTEPTRAARWFRVILVLGSAVLCVSVFLPWCRISGFTYTFFAVDSWKVLPIAELVVSTGGIVGAMIRLARIKRIGLVVGGTALALNVVGSFVAARLANVHNTDAYFRIWAVISVAPAWGGWVALLTSCVLIVGSMSRWSVCITIRDTASETSKSPYIAAPTGETVYGVPRQSHADDTDYDESRSRLPRLDEVLAPPTLPEG